MWKGFCSLVVTIAALGAAGIAAEEHRDPLLLKLDMGTGSSVVLDGYLRVDPDTAYSSELGYGWEGRPAAAEDASREEFSAWGDTKRVVDFVLGVNAMTVDCVMDPESLVFRTDLPNGEYDVSIWVGNLARPLSRLTLFANGKPLKEDFDSRTLWTIHMKTETGAARRVRSTVRVSDGKLIIEMIGDADSEEEYVEIPMGKRKVLTERVSRMAFDGVAIQGIVIHSSLHAPLEVSDGRLALTDLSAPDEAATFVRQFNAKEFAEARSTAESIDGDRWPTLKACTLLWLAGRPEVETERELLSDAIALLERRTGNDREGVVAQDLLWEAEVLSEALEAFYGFGYSRTGFGVREQMGRGEALLGQFDDPSRPPYWKAKLYLARLTCMLDPMRWAWWYDRGREMFREMEKEFPDNRWVRLYVDDELSYADDYIPEPKAYRGWEVADYRDGIEGAPEWAVHMREEFARTVDVADWWIQNRQVENGEIGGGWGDDVELVPLWSFLGMISDGASDHLMAGARKLIDGVWNRGAVNPEEGFATGFTWVKPASELVAYSQPMMIVADYGNPRYVERAMKTTKYLRDFATGINSRGHRHFKSVYLSATRLGDGPQQRLDAPLCLRPAFGASALCWYSRHPAAVGLMTEWLDSWYEDSLRTDKGKPEYIFPAAVAFETGELGGPGAQNWCDARRQGVDDSFVWPHYQSYLYDLCLLWWMQTGDEKYLKPIDELVKIARHYLPDAEDPFPKGTHPWFEDVIFAGDIVGRFQPLSTFYVKLITGTHKYDDYLLPHVQSYARYLLNGDMETMVQSMEMAGKLLRSTWPFKTSEAALTDRIAVPGFIDMFFAFTGGNPIPIHHGVPLHAVTYEDTTRNFAALVREQSDKSLQVWMYSFLAEEREVGIRPWRLEVGGTYEITAGPDSDEDGRIDVVGFRDEFVLEHRGDSVRFIMPARELQAVDVRQTKTPPEQSEHLADLGISDEDVFWLSEGELAVRIHNIGSLEAENIRVRLSALGGEGATNIGEAIISYLNAPVSLDPQTKLVSFLVTQDLRSLDLLIEIDPDDEIREITERNNDFLVTSR